MRIGSIKYIDAGKHFGLIKTEDGTEYYVNPSGIQKPLGTVRPGDIVEFESLPIRAGYKRSQAIRVRFLQGARKKQYGLRDKAPDDPGTKLFADAEEARSKKQFDRARTLYERALERTADLDVFLALAAMERDLSVEGNYERAGRVYERALSQFPEAGILYEEYGNLYAKTKPERAIQILRRGLKSDAAHKALHRVLGQALFMTADVNALSEAERHFEIAEEFGLLDKVSELQRNYIRVTLGHPRGKSSLAFLERIGFTVERILDYDDVEGMDLIVKTNRAEYVEAYGLADDIFVRCFFKPRLFVADIHALIRASQKVTEQDAFEGGNAALNQEVLFLFAQNTQGVKDHLYKILEDPGKNPAIVPIDESLLTEAARQPKPDEYFRRHLDEWLHKRNLYEENYPVSGRRFFGREQELAGLMRSIDAGTPVGLFGLRKVGKTSLLRKVQEQLAGDLVLYVDLQVVPAGMNDASYVYWLIANQLAEELKNKYPLLSASINFELAGRYPTFTPLKGVELSPQLDSDLRLLRATIRKNDDVAFRIIIMFDEIERILPNAISPGCKGYDNLFAYLRGLSQEDDAVVWIITGANPAICDTPQWEGRDNPVFKFYKEMFIPPLSKHECLEMIERLGFGMGVTYTPNALDRIYRETGGHPFVTRQLCSRISQHFKDRPLKVDVPKVEQGIEEFLFEDSDFFREIMERLKRDFPGEKEALVLIASGVNKEAEISSMKNETREALKHLIGYQLIDRQGNRFSIKLDLFSTWITRYWMNAAS
jgi:tetratricopeptide (TPR) repeat protein